NNIKEIIIYDNFFFNSVMLNIVNSCLSLEKLILKYNTTRNYFQRQRSKTVSETVFNNLGKDFQKDLINHYEKDDIVCKRDHCNEPIYWGKSIYWHYCSNHKSEFFTREHGRKISYINSDIGDSIICSDSDFNSDFEDL